VVREAGDGHLLLHTTRPELLVSQTLLKTLLSANYMLLSWLADSAQRVLQVDSVLQRAQKVVQEAGDGHLSTLTYYPKHTQHTEQLAELMNEVQQIKKETHKDVIASITGYVPKD